LYNAAEADVVAPLSVVPICAQAQDHHATVQVDDLKWSAPAAYAPGAQLAVLKGDPTKEGMYVVRLKVPAGFKIPAHTHPNDENVTVLAGSFNIGTGDKLDEKKGIIPPKSIRDPWVLGTTAVLPARHPRESCAI
jgi:anti-sigma factor ChrR (cupin superfamily)